MDVPGTSIAWDNRDPSANKVKYNLKLGGGNDSLDIPKVRIGGVATDDGTSVGPIAANGFHLQELGGGGRGNKNGHSARLSVPWAQAENILLPGKNISAARVTINGVSVGRSYGSKQGEKWNDAFFSGAGNTNVNIGGITIEGLKVNGVDMGTVTLADLMASSQGDGAMQAQIAKITGTDARAGNAGAEHIALGGLNVARDRFGNLSGGLDSASAQGVDIQGNRIDSVATGPITGSRDTTGLVRASVPDVTARGIHAGGTTVDEASAHGISVAHNAAGTNANISRVAASGVRGEGGAVTELSAQKLAVRHNAKGTNVTAAGAHAKGLKGGPGEIGSLSLSDLAATHDEQGLRGTIGSGTASDVAVGRVYASKVELDALSAGHANGVTTAGVGSVSVDAVNAGPISTPVGRIDGAGVTDLQVRHEGDVTRASASSITASGFHGDIGSLDAAAVNGVSLTHAPDRLQGSADSANFSNLAAAGINVRQLDLGGIEAGRDSQGAWTRAGSVKGRDIQHVMGSMSELDIQRLAVSADKDGKATQVDSVMIRQLKTQAASLDEVSLEKLAIQGEGATASGGVDRLAAKGITAKTANLDASVSEAEVRALQVQLGERNTFTAEGATVSGVDATMKGAPASGAGPGLDPVEALGLIRDMSAVVAADLKAGTYGDDTKVGIEEGTQATGQLTVKDGSIVPGGTSMSLSKPGDAPAWATLRGAYMKDDGAVMADIGGWRDQNITEQLGIPGATERIPLDLQALAARIPAEAPPGKQPAAESPVTGLKAKADVTLHGGGVNAGGVAVELAPGNQGQVTYKKEADGNQEIGLEFAQVLLQSLGMSEGNLDLKMQDLNAGGAKVQNKTTGSGTMTQAQLKKLQMGNIKGGF